MGSSRGLTLGGNLGSWGGYLDPGGTQLSNFATGKDENGKDKARTPTTFLDPAGAMAPHQGNAAEMAAQAEAERRARIQQTTDKINGIYDAPARQKQYSDFLGALRQNYTDDANRQKEIADRNLKFSLARNGLTGGSADVDERRTLGDEFQRGLVNAESKAQGGLSGLKAQDEQSRLNLIQLAQGGMDATTAAARAAAITSAGTQSQLADASAKGLGDIFGTTAATYKQQQEQAARRAGQVAPVGSYYGR